MAQFRQHCATGKTPVSLGCRLVGRMSSRLQPLYTLNSVEHAAMAVHGYQYLYRITACDCVKCAVGRPKADSLPAIRKRDNAEMRHRHVTLRSFPVMSRSLVPGYTLTTANGISVPTSRTVILSTSRPKCVSAASQLE